MPWMTLPNRGMEVAFARLRVGCTRLKQHMHRIKVADSPSCPHCNAPQETIEHFLLECPRYFSHRVYMKNSLRKLGITNLSTSILLGGGDYTIDVKILSMAFMKKSLFSNFLHIHHCYKFCSTNAKYERIINLLQEKPVKSNFVIKGWVKSIRKMSKKTTFIDVNDGSTLKPLQVVLFKQKPPENLSFHSSVEIHGKLEKSEYPGQLVEFIASKCKVIGDADPVTYPFQLFKDTTTGEEIGMRKLPHLRARNKSIASMLRIRSQMKSSIYEYFKKEGFINIDTPIITTNNCEGGGEIFSLNEDNELPNDSKSSLFFKTPAYLTVSGQLHLEAAASGLSKVFNFSPAFRAENAFSRRHISEFWMVEAEEAFLLGEEGELSLISRIESLVKYALQDVIVNAEEDVHFHWKMNPSAQKLIDNTLQNKFNTITYTDAIQLLLKHEDKFKRPVTDGKALSREHEQFLTNYMDDRPLFITKWPKQTKSFYACQTENENIVYGVELLVPVVGELVGAGLREYRTNIIEQNVKNINIEWYLDLRRWGMAPSGGFGLGFERLLIYLLGINNVKDSILFPRWKGNCVG